MEIVSFEEFFSRTRGGRPNKMVTKYYEGHSFECGCGKIHLFDSREVKILRELSKMGLVLRHHSCGYVNCVKVKGVLFFKGFETLFSTKDE